MVNKLYVAIGLIAMAICSFLYIVNLAVKNEQTKIDKAIVEYAGTKSKQEAKETIEIIKELYYELETTDMVCDNNGNACELW